MEKTRCRWCAGNELLNCYHDEEWCARRLHDDRGLFEFMTLEMMQCGLSWLTVMKKREAMREAFDGFDPEKISCYDDARIAELMQNKSIIRSEAKLRLIKRPPKEPQEKRWKPRPRLDQRTSPLTLSPRSKWPLPHLSFPPSL